MSDDISAVVLKISFKLVVDNNVRIEAHSALNPSAEDYMVEHGKLDEFQKDLRDVEKYLSEKVSDAIGVGRFIDNIY